MARGLTGCVLGCIFHRRSVGIVRTVTGIERINACCFSAEKHLEHLKEPEFTAEIAESAEKNAGFLTRSLTSSAVCSFFALIRITVNTRA